MDWEDEVQGRFGLSATVCSGNKFYDQGDAVDNSNPRDSWFRMMVDCKYTAMKSYGLNASKVSQFFQQAAANGKRGIMAIRFRPDTPLDLVVIGIDDFHEMLDIIHEYDRLVERIKEGRDGI